MAIDTLDPVTALVVIDLQQGIVGMPTAHPAGEIVERSAVLLKAFRERGLPVVLVNVNGVPSGRADAGHRGFTPPPGFADLVPELNQQPSDHIVTKYQWGAFHGTTLDHFLRRSGVTQIVLTGIATSIGVESTARSAHEHGYNVTIVTDAITDLDAQAHQNSLGKIFPRLAQLGTTADLLAVLPALA